MTRTGANRSVGRTAKVGRSRHRPALKVRTPTAGVVSGRNKTGEKRALAMASVLMPLTLLTPAGFTSCQCPWRRDPDCPVLCRIPSAEHIDGPVRGGQEISLNNWKMVSCMPLNSGLGGGDGDEMLYIPDTPPHPGAVSGSMLC